MRRLLQQSIDSSSYDVLEANPWRESSKPLYVLTCVKSQLCIMKARQNGRFDLLGMLFPTAVKWSSGAGNKSKQSRSGTKFQMLVEDVREGALVFEDETEAARYCHLLQGVFDLCHKRTPSVLFRRGRTPPLPQNLE
ncbi:hypothetical protein SAY87_018050 [Trapa incisa]|uniref:Uncharacterized protein n=1 Tax=Trapa incisa TaxID=236973 RepID=A0AAN7L7M9_9MYRT|nr:hypothetical protein SAY87_018050 [Trapa incisa]